MWLATSLLLTTNKLHLANFLSNSSIFTLFTFMDIRRLQGGIAINILLFDELLDSSLDQKGAELVIDILKDRVDNYNEGVYIISHRSEALKAADNDVIYLEKKNGFTRKVEHAQI